MDKAPSPRRAKLLATPLKTEEDRVEKSTRQDDWHDSVDMGRGWRDDAEE